MDGQENIEGRLDGQTNGWQDGYKKYGWMDRKKQKDGWIDIKMDGWMEQKNRWMVEWTGKHRMMVGQIKKQIDDWMDKQQMDGRMDIKKLDG